jgi:hypothetical protein
MGKYQGAMVEMQIYDWLKNGRMEEWKNGKMEEWKDGKTRAESFFQFGYLTVIRISCRMN